MNRVTSSSVSDNRILKRSFPILLISVFILLRMGYVFLIFFSSSHEEWQEWAESPDTSGYMLLAEDLTDFRIDNPSYRTPGYAFVISLVHKVIHDDQYLGILLLQQIVDGIVAYLIYLIMRRINKRVAFIPVVLYLLHPYVLSYSAKVLPGTLTSLFVMIPSYCLLKREKISIYTALIAGTLISVGIMVRPMLLFASVVLIIFIVLHSNARGKQIVLPILVLVLTATLLPTLLRQYNKNEFGINAISLQGNFEIAGQIAVETGFKEQSDMFIEGGFKDSLEALGMVDGVVDYELRESIYIETAKTLFFRNPLLVIKSRMLGWIGFLQLGNPQLSYMRLSEGDEGRLINRFMQFITLFISFIIYPGILLAIIQKNSKYVNSLGIIAILWFAYVSLIHSWLCGPYYYVPFLAIFLTAGFAGWAIYLRTKLQEPNSLLSRIAQLFQKHA